jgi:hypothetical protein
MKHGRRFTVELVMRADHVETSHVPAHEHWVLLKAAFQTFRFGMSFMRPNDVLRDVVADTH